MSDVNTVLNIKSLSKSYKKEQVLKKLNWQIHSGDIVGLLGKNGAGKSTLFKSILSLSDIDDGEIKIFNEHHQKLSAKTKGRIGYVPQENDEISWLSISDLITFKKQFYYQWSDEKVNELITRWDINTKKTLVELSPGQVQRVLIILALAPMPELLIFDEPAAALDPAARREFLKEIVSLTSEEDVAIIFSTHIVSDLERIANKVAILDQGQIRYFQDIDSTKENVVQLSIQHTKDVSIEVPNTLRCKKHAKGQNCIVSHVDKDWLTQIQAQGIDVVVTPMGLEDIFLELTL